MNISPMRWRNYYRYRYYPDSLRQYNCETKEVPAYVNAYIDISDVRMDCGEVRFG